MGSDAPPVAIRPRSLGSRPGTVIEFGSNKGASALWLADMLEVFGLRDTKVYSYDINPVTDLKDPRIVFGYCDTRDLSASLSDSFMRALPRPLLVIDDASHNYHQVLNVLEFCHRHSAPGDYFIVEDGLISIVGVEDLHGYEGGPFQAIQTFSQKYPDHYAIDRARCDFYGPNVTWNPDGYIRRIA
jgi:cephalosporin hydroxylase